MFELLDTGRLAYRFGNLRGILFVVAAAIPVAIAYAIQAVFSVIPGIQEPPKSLIWYQLAFWGFALFLVVCGLRYLWKDFTTPDYLLEAERYKREGW